MNMTFDGIEADDIPGWLDTEKYRCFRSSRPSVIENELLRVHGRSTIRQLRWTAS